MTTAIRPGEVVRLAVRNGSNMAIHNALVLAVDPLSPLTSEDGHPSIELVSINPSALHHAGTSDFDKALVRGISVVNVNHKDFVEGRASLGYMVNGATESSLRSAPGKLTVEGERWVEIHREFANKAEEQFYTEYPASTPILTTGEVVADIGHTTTLLDGMLEPAGTPSAADLDAIAEEEKAKAATATEFEKLKKMDDELGAGVVKTVYAIFVDGIQKGDCVTAEATLQKEDGTILPVTEVKEGDSLEGGIIVKSIVPVLDDAVVNIICEHVV